MISRLAETMGNQQCQIQPCHDNNQFRASSNVHCLSSIIKIVDKKKRRENENEENVIGKAGPALSL